MSRLSVADQVLLEAVLGMSGGNVLDFTNASFADFFRDVNIDVYDAERYPGFGDSKANRLRALWKSGTDEEVAKSLRGLIDSQPVRVLSGSATATLGMTVRLLLDEHYSEQIAAALRDLGHDVMAAVSDPELRGSSDTELFRDAALFQDAVAAAGPAAALLLVPPRRFPRGRGDRAAAIAFALSTWLDRPDAWQRPLEDWLT